MSDRPILLVEDNSDDIVLTRRALEQNEIDNAVVVVRDGVEALDYLLGEGAHAARDASTTPAIVLLDLKLPRLDGLQLLQRIRADARTRMLPVIILTASNDAHDLQDACTLGVTSYIRKPVDFSAFVAAIGRLKMFRLLNDAPPADVA